MPGWNRASRHEDRVKWLVAHPEKWLDWYKKDCRIPRPLDFAGIRKRNRKVALVFRALQDAGLYARTTYWCDAHFKPAMEEALRILKAKEYKAAKLKGKKR